MLEIQDKDFLIRNICNHIKRDKILFNLFIEISKMLKQKFELKWRNLVIVILQAHPWLIDSNWELLCRLMAYQKLSLEASTHAAQNERLLLRFIVQGSLL